jgi:hypothetical protein
MVLPNTMQQREPLDGDANFYFVIPDLSNKFQVCQGLEHEINTEFTFCVPADDFP